MKIYAIVVTYNRLSLLKKVIEGIKVQTTPIYELIVVNNNSSDGTTDWLHNQKGLKVINQENIGGSGGFSSGIRYAFHSGAEWIWMMDDDVIPDRNCLEVLLRYKHQSLCLQPSRLFSDGVSINWNKYFNLRSKRMFFYDTLLEEKKEVTFVNSCCFEGLLIHRTIVEKIGYPDQRFFISGDDTIYGFLANQYTNIANIRDALMTRARKSYEDYTSPMYLYYTYRNFHLFKEYYCRLYKKSNYPITTRIRQLLLGVYNCYLVLRNCRYSIKKKVILISAVIRGQIDSFKRITGKSF